MNQELLVTVIPVRSYIHRKSFGCGVWTEVPAELVERSVLDSPNVVVSWRKREVRQSLARVCLELWRAYINQVRNVTGVVATLTGISRANVKGWVRIAKCIEVIVHQRLIVYVVVKQHG